MFFFKPDKKLVLCPAPNIKGQHYGIEPLTASEWTMLFQASLISQILLPVNGFLCPSQLLTHFNQFTSSYFKLISRFSDDSSL